MSEAAEQVATMVFDGDQEIEAAVDGVVDTIEVVRNNPVVLATVGAVALAAGGVGGYFIAKKRLKSYYEDLSAQEIEEAKTFYSGVYKTDAEGKSITPQDALEELHGAEAIAAVREYQGVEAPAATEAELDEQDEAQIRKIEQARLHSVSLDTEPGPGRGKITEVKEVVETKESHNVFVDDNFDYEEEVKLRESNKPYIITHDEYFAAEREYDTQQLTYYEDDDTLTNEQDNPIQDIDGTVGDDTLVRFGHGSRDRNIVYVRNERLETDYEVVKSSKSYLQDVLGLDDEDDNSLKHSDQLDRRRAFKRGDG